MVRYSEGTTKLKSRYFLRIGDTWMSQINVHVRLRPVRFAFLVRPDDGDSALEIFRINTCLWGGKFNPIIPFFKRVPTWWDRHQVRFDSAKQIVNGYLDRFEPDFLVEAEEGLADGLGFSTSRVLQLTEVLARAGDRAQKGYGLNTFDLYKHLYQTEFQFVRRHKHNITHFTSEDPAFDAFCACAFGAFPHQRNLGYIGRAFMDAFDPKVISLTGESIAKAYRSGFTSALRLGHSKIEVEYHDHSNATLFVMNALEPRDLIDYWNLRTLQRDIVAIPIQWLDQLSEFCRAFIKKRHRPMPDNRHGVELRATAMFSRSIPASEIEGLHKKYLYVDQPGANVLQIWYPSIWRPSPSWIVKSSRPKLMADERSFELPIDVDKPSVSFDSVHPSFAEKYGNENRWANVVRLRAWSSGNPIATVAPIEYRDPAFSPYRVGGEVLLSTTEGFVQFPRFRDIPHYWQLRDGQSAIGEWLKVSKIEVKLSPAGRATQQIVQSLGGFGGVRGIAHAGIVKLLNEMSRRPTAKSMHHQEFMNKVEGLVKGDVWREGAARLLISQGAVELGLELKCTKCSSWSWYSLKQLDYRVSCSLCLRDFGFPIIEPSNSDNARWAYRVVGPFALPDYASGGYAASLAIRFFADVIGGHDTAVTWSSGQELTFSSGKKVETDFILWYQRKEMFGTDRPTEIIFGETKSFGRDGPRTDPSIRGARKEDLFEDKDIVRMKLLAEAFPGAVLVFATMREASDMSKDELARIRKLAEWGREYVTEWRQSRAPVILLTGTELFAGYSLQGAWKEKGGKHAELGSHGQLRLENLKVLADLTQVLYLSMPSYSAWSSARRDARRKLREKRALDGGGAAK